MFEGSHRLQKGKGLGTATCPSTSCGSPPLEKSGGGDPSSLASGFFKRNLSSGKQFPVLPFYIKIKSKEVRISSSRFSSDFNPRSIPRSSEQTVRMKRRGNRVASYNTSHALGASTPLDDHQSNPSKETETQVSFPANFHHDKDFRDPSFASLGGVPGLNGDTADPRYDHNGSPSSLEFVTASNSVPSATPLCHQATQVKMPQSFYLTIYKSHTPVADD